MRIKPSAYEYVWIYYILNFLKVLNVSAAFCDHLHWDDLRRVYYKDIKTIVQIYNIKIQINYFAKLRE